MSKKSIVLFLNKEEHLIIKKALRIFDKHYPDGKTIKLLSDDFGLYALMLFSIL